MKVFCDGKLIETPFMKITTGLSRWRLFLLAGRLFLAAAFHGGIMMQIGTLEWKIEIFKGAESVNEKDRDTGPMPEFAKRTEKKPPPLLIQ